MLELDDNRDVIANIDCGVGATIGPAGMEPMAPLEELSLVVRRGRAPSPLDGITPREDEFASAWSNGGLREKQRTRGQARMEQRRPPCEAEDKLGGGKGRDLEATRVGGGGDLVIYAKSGKEEYHDL